MYIEQTTIEVRYFAKFDRKFFLPFNLWFSKAIVKQFEQKATVKTIEVAVAGFLPTNP